MKVIIYPFEGGITVLTPVAEHIPVEEIAKKDVPTGLPYLIIDAADVPKDETLRGAWEADFTIPNGHGIGHYPWVDEQIKKKDNVMVNTGLYLVESFQRNVAPLPPTQNDEIVQALKEEGLDANASIPQEFRKHGVYI